MATEFEWDILLQKPSFFRETLRRCIVLVPVWIALTYGIFRVAQSLPYIKSSELIVIMEVWAIGLLSLINQQWHSVFMALPDTLIHFSITSEGLTVGKKHYPLASLRQAIGVLREVKRPKEEWDQPRPADGKPIVLRLPTSEGTVTLKFAEEAVKQQFIQSLMELLSSS